MSQAIDPATEINQSTSIQDQVASTTVSTEVSTKKNVTGISDAIAAMYSANYIAGEANNPVLITSSTEADNNQDNLSQGNPQSGILTVIDAMGDSYSAEADIQDIVNQKNLAATLEQNFYDTIQGLSIDDQINEINNLISEGGSPIVENALSEIKSMGADLDDLNQQYQGYMDAAKEESDKLSNTPKFMSYKRGDIRHQRNEFLQAASEVQAAENEVVSDTKKDSDTKVSTSKTSFDKVNDGFSQMLNDATSGVFAGS